jgi:hypothetical protein
LVTANVNTSSDLELSNPLISIITSSTFQDDYTDVTSFPLVSSMAVPSNFTHILGGSFTWPVHVTPGDYIQLAFSCTVVGSPTLTITYSLNVQDLNK